MKLHDINKCAIMAGKESHNVLLETANDCQMSLILKRKKRGRGEGEREREGERGERESNSQNVHYMHMYMYAILVNKSSFL